MTPTVSAVVPTYRRDDLLGRCLAALAAQELDPSAYEVIVCDDAASDTTRQLVETWDERSRAPMRYLAVCGTRGPAAARNRGWRAARGRIIAFTDDDCVPQPGWLSAGLRAFHACGSQEETAGNQGSGGPSSLPDAAPTGHIRAPAAMAVSGEGRHAGAMNPPLPMRDAPVAGVCGRIIVPLPPTPTDYERDAAGLEAADFATANCFYRRDALEDVGGFDERFTTAWREDADLFLTLLERRYHLVHAPAAVVVHPVRPVRWGVSMRQQRKSMFNALLYKKHPALYRQHIQATPPLRYYAISSALLVAVAGALSGRGRLTHAGGGLWLILTGAFCARRLSGTSRAPRHVAEMVATSVVIPPLSAFWRICGALKFRVLFC